jgi:glycosyltransferase involved in cell wall biosynthesis/O-antigen/teichoic acid export membrane protein
MTLVARLVQPEEYGLFNMAAVLINLLEGSYDLGIRRALIYFGGAVGAASLRRTGFVLSIGAGLVLSVLLFALSPLAAAFYGEVRVRGLMQVLSIYFGIACLGVVPDALLQQRLAFNRRFWPSIAAPAGRYAIAIPLAALGLGAWSLVWGQLLGITVEVCLLLSLAGWRPRPGWSPADAAQLLRYSSQISLVEWIAAIGLNLDYILVGHFLGSGVLGLYTLAFKLPDATIGAAGWVGSRVLLPAFLNLGGQRDRLADGCLQALRVAVAVLLPLGAGLCVLAPQIVPLLFGEQWSPAIPIVQLLVVSACLGGALQVVGAAFMAAGQPRKIVVAQLAWLAVLAPVLFIAAQTSIQAVALAHIAAMCAFVGVKLSLVPRTLGLSLNRLARGVQPSVLAAAAMLLTLLGVTRLTVFLPLEVLLAAATYLVILRMLSRRRRPRNERLRVAMIIQSYYPHIGGAETNLQALVQPLRELRVDAQVLTRQRDRRHPLADCIGGAPVVRIPAPGGQLRASLTFVVLTTLHAMRESFDLVHAHELRSPTLTAVCIKMLLGRPVVAHLLRGGSLGDLRVLTAAPFGRVRWWLFRCAVDRFVAVSRETEHELRAMGVPDRKIAFVPYGVDTRRFRPATYEERRALRERLHLEGRRVVLVVARLVPEKRFDCLLAAWPLVVARVPEALLVLVGDGPERQRLECLAQQLDGVRFTGQLHDPLPYLQAADCLTLPSSTEGQPISLLEAMATGLVCVGTNIGGITDALENGRLGVLVQPGDPNGLALALIDVLELSQAARECAGARAREKIVARHSIEANAAALRQLYEQLA